MPPRETLDARTTDLYRNHPEVVLGIPRLYRRFCEIVSIPSPSGREFPLGGYLGLLAEKHGFHHEADEIGNHLIEMPATKGYEDAPGLVLQAHLDRVCLGEPDPNINPIIPVISADGKWIQSKGRKTTLGADNGIGVATMISLMDERTPHGRIALLFTVREEGAGGMMNGAGKSHFNLDKYKYLINLDHERENELVVHSACAGSSVISLKIPESGKIPVTTQKMLRISVSGLKGGHSGLDIDKDRANGIKLLSGLLKLIGPEKFNLMKVTGGTRGSAIPSQAEAVIAVDNPLLENSLRNLLPGIQKLTREYKKDDGIKFDVAAAERTDTSLMLNNAFTQKVIDLLTALPTGPKESDAEGVITSTNLATVEIKDGEISVRMMTRSAENDKRDEYLREIENTAKIFGADIETSTSYPSWKIDKDNQLVRLAEEAWQKALGKKIEKVRVHAGIELSPLSQNYGHLFMGSFGPTILDAHTTNEQVYIPSIVNSWKGLKKFISLVAAEKPSTYL